MRDYVIREEGMPVLFDTDDGETLNTMMILQEKYSYIIESMKKEEYIIEKG